MKKSNKNLTFSSKIGLIAATVGSAVGLGNIWRFPAVAQANGGGAFLIIYIGCVILLGIPVMLAEFSIGRAGKSDAMELMADMMCAAVAADYVGAFAADKCHFLLTDN